MKHNYNITQDYGDRRKWKIDPFNKIVGLVY
jgi:hypothetical protein